MAHEHEYETVERHAVSAKARELGIEDAEIRRCKVCDYDMAFVLAHGKWFNLFEESERDAGDILLA